MFRLNSAFIRKLLFERKLSIRQLAKQARLNEVTARKVIDDGASVTLRTVAALADFFGVDGDELILKG